MRQALSRNRIILWFAVIVFIGFAARMVHFNDGLGGDHVFRQAAVADQIRSLLTHQNSPVLKPFEPFNHWPGSYVKIYETPVYEYVTAKISSLTNINYLLIAKSINIFLYVITAIILALLARMIFYDDVMVIITLYAYVFSPLNMHFNSTDLPDNLPILLSIMSLYLFLRFEERNRTRDWYESLVCGVISAAIKPPVYFTMTLTIAYHRLRNRGWRDIVSGRTFVFLAMLALTVVMYAVITAYVNWGTYRNPMTSWYFGTLDQRMQWHWWKPFPIRLAKQFGTPILFFVFVRGLYILIRSYNYKYRAIMLGWVLSTVVTVLVFFNVYSIHNYYELPFIPLYALIVAIGGKDFVIWIQRRMSVPLQYITLTIFTIITIAWALDGSRVMNYTADKVLKSDGALIQKLTPSDSYVLWEGCNNNPAPLYFARRRGSCVGISQINEKFIANIFVECKSEIYRYLYLYAKAEDVGKSADGNLLFNKVVGGTGQSGYVLYRITQGQAHLQKSQ